MITANDTTQDAYGTSADLMDQSTGAFQNFLTGSGSLSNINEYINPYYNEVLDSTLARMDTDLQKQLGTVGDDAVAAGAFGGSRHGIVEGEAIGQHNLNVGDVSAQISSDAYTDAANRAFQDQLTGATGLADMGQSYYNIGNDITDRTLYQGTMEQSLLQSILDSAVGSYDQYMAEPYGMIDMLNALLQGDVRRGAGTAEGESTSTPGMLDYLSAGLQTAGGV